MTHGQIAQETSKCQLILLSVKSLNLQQAPLTQYWETIVPMASRHRVGLLNPCVLHFVSGYYYENKGVVHCLQYYLKELCFVYLHKHFFSLKHLGYPMIYNAAGFHFQSCEK